MSTAGGLVARPADRAPARPPAQAASQGSGGGWLRRSLWFAAGIICITVVLATRRGGLGSGRIWAEDGTVFLSDAATADGIIAHLGLIFQPAAGQLWVLQRVIADGVVALPAPLWPSAMYLVSCVGAAGALAVLWQQRGRAVFGPLWWRVVAVLLLALLPAVGEVHGNPANLHWWLLGAGLVLMAYPTPRTAAGRVAELAFLGVVAVTGISGLILVPLAVWTGWRRRDRYQITRAGWVLVGTIVALATVALSGRAAPLSAYGNVWHLPEVFLARVGGALTAGSDAARQCEATGSYPWPVLAGAGLLVALVVTLAVFDRRGPSLWWLLTGVWALALGLVGSAALVSWQVTYCSTGNGRHIFTAIFATMLVIIRALGRGTAAARIGGGLALAMCALSLAWVETWPSNAEVITPTDLAAFQECLERGASPQQPCVLPVAPEGWQIRVE